MLAPFDSIRFLREDHLQMLKAKNTLKRSFDNSYRKNKKKEVKCNATCKLLRNFIIFYPTPQP